MNPTLLASNQVNLVLVERTCGGLGIPTLDGMPVAWASQHQKCVGTSYKEGLDDAEMAQSSADVELYAAADTLKLALHLSDAANELNIPMPSPIIMLVDATAAIVKLQGPRGGGKLKHTDLGQAWIKLLKNCKVVEVVKVPGEATPSDCMTKTLGRVAFNKSESELMGRIDEDGRK